MSRTHPYIPNSDESIMRQMLRDIGAGTIEDLFKDIPSPIRTKASLAIPSKLSEMEARRHVEALLNKNLSTRDLLSFLGGGVWPHHVPAAVDAITSRGEFLTSYTPYQPEISQGMLQALFEYQSMICELTSMDYANSSLYDWSTALGEAARMASRVTHRDEFIVPHFIHPERLSTLRTFCEPADIKVVEIAQDKRTGALDLADLKRILSAQTAGVYVEYPSFLGFVEQSCEEIAQLAHDGGALFLVGSEPISLGVLKAPGEMGADIVVGEGQPLGNHMNYGGPLLGIFACKGDSLLRQMPGRIIGKTTTQDGKQDAYCMALQTREQHIRREKATSNICTNEALLALAAASYLALLGPKGITELCSTILDRTIYATDQLQKIRGVSAPGFEAFHFMEFTVNFDKTGKSVAEINASMLNAGIHGGLDVSRYFPELGQTALYCFTEVHTHRDIDMLADKLRQVLGA
ncbi:MAG: aminomethyl-transferring glycine dehydrogenase subunit GcvPA [Candidatus Bathyarchaeia archaeon]